MATYWAQKSGNIDADDVWYDAASGGNLVSGATALAGTHILRANGRTIIINVSFAATQIDTSNSGGSFTVSGSSALTITAKVQGGSGTGYCVTSTHTGTGDNKVTIIGALQGGANGGGWDQQGAGDLSITGNIANAGGAYAPALRCAGSGIVNFAGSVKGGNSGGHGIVQSGGTLYVTGGPVQGSTTAAAVGISISGGVATSITANVTGGNKNGSAGVARKGGTHLVAITGNVAGGAYAGVPGVSNYGAPMEITGTVTGGSTENEPGCYGVIHASTSYYTTIIGSLIDTEQCSATAGRIYWQPVAGVHYHKVFYAPATPKYYSLPPAQTDVRDGVFAGFSDGVAYNGDVVVPSAGDVRHGVDFDSHGKETGTLHLPAVTDVKTGVAYGAGGTEFEGELVGGGAPLIGPGGLVG